MSIYRDGVAAVRERLDDESRRALEDERHEWAPMAMRREIRELRVRIDRPLIDPATRRDDLASYCAMLEAIPLARDRSLRRWGMRLSIATACAIVASAFALWPGPPPARVAPAPEALVDALPMCTEEEACHQVCLLHLYQWCWPSGTFSCLCGWQAEGPVEYQSLHAR